MPTQAETAEDRDARLERLALERDRAVALLRAWHLTVGRDQVVPTYLTESTREFLESLT